MMGLMRRYMDDLKINLYELKECIPGFQIRLCAYHTLHNNQQQLYDYY